MVGSERVSTVCIEVLFVQLCWVGAVGQGCGPGLWARAVCERGRVDAAWSLGLRGCSTSDAVTRREVVLGPNAGASRV